MAGGIRRPTCRLAIARAGREIPGRPSGRPRPRSQPPADARYRAGGLCVSCTGAPAAPAREKASVLPTPSQEDYLKAIWLLVQHKGYARVSDVADRLGVSRASASKMVQRLSDQGLLAYERYRGFSVTPRGEREGRALYDRQSVVERFLAQLAIGSSERIHRTMEGMEHHVDADAVRRFASLARYIDEHPAWWAEFLDSARPRGPAGEA